MRTKYAKCVLVGSSATMHATHPFCSSYLPPIDRINIADLEHLIHQLPKPYVIMGDFNSHDNVLGCRDTDQKCRIIDVINRNNLLLYLIIYTEGRDLHGNRINFSRCINIFGL